MIILVSNTFDTYKAQIRSSVEKGFKQLYTASCTSGERAAAQAVVRKFFTEEAAESVTQLTDPEQVRILTGDFKANPQRKQVFTYWTFDHQVKAKAKPTKHQAPSTKDAVKTKHEAKPSPLSDFAAARKHADTIRSGLRRTVAACVALGLELDALKTRIGAKHGGARSNYFTLPWKELVAQETGFTYQRCQDFMNAAKEVRKRLTGSRKKDDAKVKLIVQSPPSEWTDGDYDAFADVIGANFDCDTFKALWSDLFPPAAPKLPSGGGEDLVQGDFYQAMLDAHACIASPIVDLHRTAANPEQFIRHLDELPLDDQDIERGDRKVHIHGLRTLQTVLTQISDEIERTIKAKAKTARAPKA
jgi:hypothetical protein